MKIIVPKPCTASWKEMTLQKRGRFCNQCEKEVVDFTTYTDKQLIEFLSDRKEKICGRFNNRQLERELILRNENKKFVSRIIAIFLGILTSLKIFSQDLSRDECGKNRQQLIVRGCRPTIEIEGVVTDISNNEPIIFANVYFTGSKTGTITDLEGKFKIKIDPAKNLNDSIKIRYITYRDTIIAVKKLLQSNAVQKLNISLNPQMESLTMGAVVLEMRQPLHKKIAGKIKRLFIRKIEMNEPDEL